MKVGLIFECGPQGADKKVCEHLIKQFFPTVTLAPSATMSDKKLLVMNCGKAARALLESGCDLVLIIWDEQPRWGEIEQTTLCFDDVNKVRKSLSGEAIDDDRVRLVCIKQELETWFLADHLAISNYVSRKKKFRCPQHKAPNDIKNPKKRLTQIFNNAKFAERYIDIDHAYPLVREITSLERLRRVQSFERFEQLLIGTAPDCTRHQNTLKQG